MDGPWGDHTEPCLTKIGIVTLSNHIKSRAGLWPAKWWGLKISNFIGSTHKSHFSSYRYPGYLYIFQITHHTWQTWKTWLCAGKWDFPSKASMAGGNALMISCKKVMPYGRKPFIWLHCCREWKLTGQCYLQSSWSWVKSCLPYLCK